MKPPLIKELAKFHFKVYDHYPERAFTVDDGYLTMRVMEHDFGYWVILLKSGKGINIGTFKTIEDVVALVEIFEKNYP